jgi:hypothetical protein
MFSIASCFRFIVGAVALSLAAGCSAAPASEGSTATEEAVTSGAGPVCDPVGRPPKGEHWDSKLCKWVPN